MGNEFPWYSSGILKAQIVAFVLAAASFFNYTFDFDLDSTVTAVFAGIGALMAVYTSVKRLRSPSPNLTEAANVKEKELIKEGKIPANVQSVGAAKAAKDRHEN